MTKLTLDADLKNRLLNLTEPLELCDETGRIRARLFPAEDPAEYEFSEPPISEEEMTRRAQSNEKRYTTAEVLAYLEKL